MREQENYIHRFYASNGRRTLDHYQGCLLGGAIGDALGSAVEFDSLDEIKKNYGGKGIQRYGHAFNRTGAITDDTQMTLFTAEGLLRGCARANAKGIGPSFLSTTYYAYRRWLVTQEELGRDQIQMDGWLSKEQRLFSRRAPGGTCLSALRTGNLYQLEGQVSPNESKGCGAVMRTAPVGLFAQSPYVKNIWDAETCDKQAFSVARDIGYLTHGHPDGYLPGAVLGLLIGRIIDGDSLPEAIGKVCHALKNEPGAEETLNAINKACRLAETTREPSPEKVALLGEGWVGEEALAIALYCALVAKDDFSFGIRLAVNHAGDSDSTGAITGNILGSLLGRKGIDGGWLKQLELSDVILQMASDIFVSYSGDDLWLEKYPGH